MIVKLYLTKDTNLPHEYSLLLDSIAMDLRLSFTQCIQEIGKGRERNPDWWVSELASRNTYVNPLFLRCCYLEMVRRLLDHQEPIEEITADSFGLYRALRRLRKERRYQVKMKFRWLSRLWIISCFKPFITFGYRVSILIRQRYAAFVTRRYARSPKEEIMIVDTFVFDHSFRGYAFEDRYYGEFGGCLSEEQLRSVWLIPTLLNVRKYTAIFLAMRSAKENFLAKEDFLRISDYVYALGYSLRAIALRPKQTKMGELDITPLVRSAWFESLASNGSIEGLLKFRFALRLKEKNVRIRLVIEWFENQNIDKGATIGFRTYYPEVKIVGYQLGIEYPFYLCYYPTAQEFRSSVLPHQIAVSGKKFIDAVKEFAPELDVVLAPAFRNRGVWKERKHYPDTNFFTVMVILPITLYESEDILELVASIPPDILPNMLRLWIKLHPAGARKEVIERYTKTMARNLEFIEGTFDEWVEKCDLIVGNNSSALLETLARGIPVVVVGSRRGIIQNPVPNSVQSDLWRVCYTPVEFSSALDFYASQKNEGRRSFLEAGRKVRNDYFEPVTEDAVRRFLRL